MKSDGTVGARRNFARREGFTKTEQGATSGADGLAVDAKGKALGIIPLPKAPQNLAFAGKDKKTLYVVGRGSAYRIATLTSGYSGRAR